MFVSGTKLNLEREREREGESKRAFVFCVNRKNNYFNFNKQSTEYTKVRMLSIAQVLLLHISQIPTDSQCTEHWIMVGNYKTVFIKVKNPCCKHMEQKSQKRRVSEHLSEVAVYHWKKNRTFKNPALKWLVTQEFKFFVGFPPSPPSAQGFFCYI